MTPERWQQLKAALDGLAALSADSREAGLAEIRARDPELAAEAASLLAANPAESFLLVPQAAPEHSVVPGMQLGPYEVLSPLGQGGMGEVWRARDTTLRRDVALKVLPPAVARDADRLSRFRREARVLASFNHPNIGAIYGFHESGPNPALVLELVEGQTLASLLRHGPLPVREALRIAGQVAEALEAAHERGVVHRDLKPGNVMLRSDGMVKVLDFGLAKALAPDDGEPGATLPTVTVGLGRPGLLIGTPAYMSPEQVRGEAADPRSDIWAFGCVLYEMLVGRPAFGASTITESLAKVLEGQADLGALPAGTPPSIVRLVRRCLDRSPRNRVQHIGDARADLADAGAGEPAEGGRVTSSSPQSATRRLWARYGVAAMVLVAMGALAVPGARLLEESGWLSGDAAREWSLRAAEVVPLTSSGNASLPALSPDGRSIAYVQTDEDGDSLWSRQTNSPSNQQIVTPREGVTILAVTVTPDSAFVHFVTREKSAARLWRVPLFGGAAQPILNGVHSAIGWAPDGSRFAFVRLLGSPGESALVVADADGRNARVLARQSHAEHGRVFLTGIGGGGIGPAWSPDGTVLALAAVGFPGGTTTHYQVFVNADDGAVRALPQAGFGWGGWVDGASLLWSMLSEVGAPRQLWRLSYPSGQMTRETNDVSDYGGVRLTADGDAFVTTRRDTENDIWMGDGSGRSGADLDTSAARPVATAGFGGQVAWAGDRLLYASPSGGRSGIWSIRSTQPPEELVPTADSPSATADGGAIVYVSREQGADNSLWRADADARGGTRLVLEANWPVITPDGRQVLFISSSRSTTVTLWSQAIDGGDPTQIVDLDARNPDVSRDGQAVAFINSSNAQTGIVICELPGCRSRRRFTPPGLPAATSTIRWTPDGRGVAYVNASAGPNIWIQPLDGSAPRPLTRFTDGRMIGSFAWSADGARLAIVRGKTSTDIVLFRGIRGLRK